MTAADRRLRSRRRVRSAGRRYAGAERGGVASPPRGRAAVVDAAVAVDVEASASRVNCDRAATAAHFGGRTRRPPASASRSRRADALPTMARESADHALRGPGRCSVRSCTPSLASTVPSPIRVTRPTYLRRCLRAVGAGDAVEYPPNRCSSSSASSPRSSIGSRPTCPGIYASGDRRASRDAGRRHAELKPVVDAYARVDDRRRRTSPTPASCSTASTDAEMREYLRAEIAEKEAQLAELEARIKELLLPARSQRGPQRDRRDPGRRGRRGGEPLGRRPLPDVPALRRAPRAEDSRCSSSQPSDTAASATSRSS